MRILNYFLTALSFTFFSAQLNALADVERPVQSYSVNVMRLVSAQAAFERSPGKSSRDQLFSVLTMQESQTVSAHTARAMIFVMDFDTKTQDWEALSASSRFAVEQFRSISAEYPKLYFNARYAQAASEIFVSEFDSDKPMRDLRREITSFRKSGDLTPEKESQLKSIISRAKVFSRQVILEQEADRLNDCAGSMIGTCGNPYYRPDHRRVSGVRTSPGS